MFKDHQKFKSIRNIGKGSFGTVKEAIHLPTGETLAIKILKKSDIKNNEDLLRIKREISILRKLDHVNIVKLYDILETNKYYFLLLEKVGNGTLEDIIRRQNGYTRY